MIGHHQAGEPEIFDLPSGVGPAHAGKRKVSLHTEAERMSHLVLRVERRPDPIAGEAIIGRLSGSMAKASPNSGSSPSSSLDELVAGMPLVFAGNRVTYVTDELAAAFAPGDQVIVVQDSGAILHLPQTDVAIAADAVGAAVQAFGQMGTVADDQVSAFYEEFARRLADDITFAPIAEANGADVEAARARGRSTTRLELAPRMRADMVAGLRTWRDAPSTRGSVLDTIDHDGWSIEQVRSGLGVVGFVFEGRPNVFADATGVLRSGNTVVFRIGSDALGTAAAIAA